MLHDKKPKKNKYTDPKTGEFRHTDGDRRHRRGASAKDAVKNKKRMRELGGALPTDETEDDEYMDDIADESDTNA
jgi:hypothetical protein